MVSKVASLCALYLMVAVVHRYGMFASVSSVLKEELGPHLQAIVERMMESLTSDEGVKVRGH